MTPKYVIGLRPGSDYAEKIRQFRVAHGLTQQALADRLGVSFVTVNRWENGQSKPSQLSWTQIRQLESIVAEPPSSYGDKEKNPPAVLDFTAKPEAVKVLAEGERLSFGHLTNPTFATEISSIDPLPHQSIAVYDCMLCWRRSESPQFSPV
jgi:transcriptional regulator with XRE-family HTH domain